MRGNLSIVRQVFERRFSTLQSSSTLSSRPSALSSSARSPILPPNLTSSQISRNSLFSASTFGASIEFNFSNTSLPCRRSLYSAAGGENGVVIVKSEQEFTNAMKSEQDPSQT